MMDLEMTCKVWAAVRGLQRRPSLPKLPLLKRQNSGEYRFFCITLPEVLSHDAMASADSRTLCATFKPACRCAEVEALRQSQHPGTASPKPATAVLVQPGSCAPMQMAATDLAMPELPAVAGGAESGQLDPSRDSPVVDIILEDPDVAEHTSSVHDHEQHLKALTNVCLASRHPARGEKQQQDGSSGPAAGEAAAQPAEGPQPILAGAGLCSSEARGPAWLQAQGKPAQGDQRLDEGFQLELDDDEEAGCSIIWEPVLGQPAADAGWQAPGTQADLQQQQQGFAEPLGSSGRWGAATSENRLRPQPAGALAGAGSGASPSSLLTSASEPGAGPAAAADRAPMPGPGLTAPAADAPGCRSLSQAALDDVLSQMSEPDCPLVMESEGGQNCTWQQSQQQGTVCCDHAYSDDDCSVACVEDSATEGASAQLQQKAAEDGPAAMPGSDSAAADGLNVPQQPLASSWDAAWEAGEALNMFCSWYC